MDYIAHSVRDREVDEEFIGLMKKRHVFYSPTLTREFAVFTYSETPDFFSDPFFLKEADPAEIAKMKDPKRQDTIRQDSGAALVQGSLAGCHAQSQDAFRRGHRDRDGHRQRRRTGPVSGLLRAS